MSAGTNGGVAIMPGETLGEGMQVETWRPALWQQFGAAIDMLDDALRACPEDLWRASLWEDPSVSAPWDAICSRFWYLAYHTVFLLDLHLSGSDEGFAPPAPFSTADPPERVYTRAEVRRYLAHGRRKCQATIDGLTDEQARRPVQWLGPGGRTVTYAELLLKIMRHVQDHGAQLNMFLGQQRWRGTDWADEARPVPALSSYSDPTMGGAGRVP